MRKQMLEKGALMILFSFLTLQDVDSQGLNRLESPGGYQITEDGKNICFIQTGDMSRGFYIHPLYDLHGYILTEDAPEDHPHHRGVFWAWHQLIVDGEQKGDPWLIEDIGWQLDNMQFQQVDSTLIAKATISWMHVPDSMLLMHEHTRIVFYPAKSGHRIIDFEIILNAAQKNTLIGGDNSEKGYGGFSIRLQLPEDIQFTSDNGLVKPENSWVEAGYWMDFNGSFATNGKKSGITLICHQETPGFPQPWILRQSGSMQNAVWPGSDPVPLLVEEPVTLKYRLVIHDGVLDKGLLSKDF